MIELNRKTKVWLLIIAFWIAFIIVVTIVILFPIIGIVIALVGISILMTLAIKLFAEDFVHKQFIKEYRANKKPKPLTNE